MRGIGREEPVFLVGAERSGTTMFSLMLGHHGDLAWGGDMHFLVACLPEEGGWPDMDEYRDWLALDRTFRMFGLEADRRLGFPDILHSFLEQQRAKFGRPRVGATVHKDFHRLLRVWPKARFIHLVRDPRDVARSVVQMGWAGNTWHAVQRWIDAEIMWERMRAELSPAQVLEVRFEELVSDPHKVLSAVCEFAELSQDPGMLDYPTDSTYDFPHPRVAYSWKKKAPRRDVRLVEARAAELMIERRYPLSGLPAAEPGRLERAYLAVENRLARMRFRLRTFRPWLYAVELVARRLRLAWLARPARLRMQEIRNDLLK